MTAFNSLERTVALPIKRRLRGTNRAAADGGGRRRRPTAAADGGGRRQ
jgi:hypothetical protein